MNRAELLVVVAGMLSTLALTRLVLWQALRSGMLDVPNVRSSHKVPTPRGGGLAIAITILSGSVLSCWLRFTDATTMAAPLAMGAIVAAIGYMDDKRGLSAATRFAVHLAASVVTVTTLLFATTTRGTIEPVSWAVAGVLVLGIAWSINLFNFMDGIDGIAASEALFVAASGAAFAFLSDHHGLFTILLLTASASAGFLVWNWPPAKIFMGDVGSGFLGFWLGAMMVALYLSGVVSIWTSAILAAAFIADSTTTLLRRLLRGEQWYEAHRTHAYQRLAVKWGSHTKVTSLLWLLNVLVLLPLAVVSVRWPEHAVWLAVTTLLGLAAACWLGGAGQGAQVAQVSRPAS